jgi:hypothetical protein
MLLSASVPLNLFPVPYNTVSSSLELLEGIDDVKAKDEDILLAWLSGIWRGHCPKLLMA